MSKLTQDAYYYLFQTVVAALSTSACIYGAVVEHRRIHIFFSVYGVFFTAWMVFELVKEVRRAK